MINKHENNEPLRIWSAGCATGEEPYSIAILVAESYFNENTDTEIFATDIDANVLEQAKAGEYHPDSIKEVKYGLLKKYFVEKADTFVVVEKIRKMVEFSFHDQLGSRNTVPRDSIYGDFDLVLCRNVMIYYDHRQREIIMQRLFNSLRYGGYLILGESEEISARFSSKCRQVAPASKIFKKILK
jgi:chemotaxis methyl-accepting protein methylase